jgi:hypothetical protein
VGDRRLAPEDCRDEGHKQPGKMSEDAHDARSRSGDSGGVEQTIAAVAGVDWASWSDVEQWFAAIGLPCRVTVIARRSLSRIGSSRLKIKAFVNPSLVEMK